MHNKIALVGTSSTGKTTTFNLLKNELPQYKFINESTREIKNCGFKINEDGTDTTQLAISTFHLAALLEERDVILDRCYLDLLVYTGNIPGISEEVRSYVEQTWEKVKDQYTHFIYFPIEFKSVDDGVRSVNEQWRKNIDRNFVDAIKYYKLPYTVATGSPQQKVKEILRFIKD